MKVLFGATVRSTAQTTLIFGLRLCGQAGTFFILAQVLGPSDFGAFVGYTSVAVLLGIVAPLGTNLSLFHESLKNQGTRDSALALALGSTVLSGLILITCFTFLIREFINFGTIEFGGIFFIGISEILLQPLVGLIAVEFHAAGNVPRAQAVLAVPMVLRFVVAAIIWIFLPENSIQWYSAGHFFSVLVVLIFARKLLSRPWPNIRSWRLPRKGEYRQNAGYAAMSLTGTGVTEIDKVLATHLLTLALAGSYAVAARFINALMLPVLAHALSALPKLVKLNSDSSTRLSQSTHWIMLGSIGYGCCAGIGVWLISPLIERLFGSEYAGLSEQLRLLVFMVPGFALHVAGANIFIALARPWFRVGVESLGLLVLVVATTQLSASFGLDGFLIAVVLTEWVIGVFFWLGLCAHNYCERSGD